MSRINPPALFCRFLKEFYLLISSEPRIFRKEIKRMANLKRNKIELLKNVEEVEKGGEPEFETYWTPPFIPWRKIREAMQLQMEIEKEGANELDLMDKMADFVANDIYGGRFTKDDLYDRLHCPDGNEEIIRQVQFLANGEAAGTSKNV